MKNIRKTILLIFLPAMLFAAGEPKTESFAVSGNCNMCKATIEKSLKKKDGVLERSWDKKQKLLTVTYDPGKTNIEAIAAKVAGAGYDNQYQKASDEAYNKLHHCCKYDRKN